MVIPLSQGAQCAQDNILLPVRDALPIAMHCRIFQSIATTLPTTHCRIVLRPHWPTAVTTCRPKAHTIHPTFPKPFECLSQKLKTSNDNTITSFTIFPITLNVFIKSLRPVITPLIYLQHLMLKSMYLKGT